MRETIQRSRPESKAQVKHRHFNKVQVKAEEIKQIRKENVDMTDYILYVEDMIENCNPIEPMTYKQWLEANER